MAAYVELYMDQGATFTNTINLTDDFTNAYVNISSYMFRSQMRRSYYSINPSANLICTVTDAANGELTLTLPASSTANVKAGRYLFDIEVIYPMSAGQTENTVSRIVEGIITVTPEVTK